MQSPRMPQSLYFFIPWSIESCQFFGANESSNHAPLCLKAWEKHLSACGHFWVYNSIIHILNCWHIRFTWNSIVINTKFGSVKRTHSSYWCYSNIHTCRQDKYLFVILNVPWCCCWFALSYMIILLDMSTSFCFLDLVFFLCRYSIAVLEHA